MGLPPSLPPLPSLPDLRVELICEPHASPPRLTTEAAGGAGPPGGLPSKPSPNHALGLGPSSSPNSTPTRGAS